MRKDLSNTEVIHSINNQIELIRFQKLMEYSNDLIHCFSTRIGGVSTGNWSSLNLGFNSEDLRENILVNINMISECIKVDINNLVFSKQVHGDQIRIVTSKNRGEGITVPICEECDGLMTNEPNVALITFVADCVPVLFYDPIKKVIAATHAGWRGTVKKIACKTVKKMEEVYDSNEEDIIACIGPSIGPCCFEVGEQVLEEFKKSFSFYKELINENDGGKVKINLWKANAMQLIEIGLKESNICLSELCTVCNNDTFYSYRGDNGETGRLGAIIQLR